MPTWKLKDSWSCYGTGCGGRWPAGSCVRSVLSRSDISRDACNEWSSSWQLSSSCTLALSGTREVRAEAMGGCSVRRDHSTPPASDSEGSASALRWFQATRVGCMSGRTAALRRGTMPTAARTLRGPCIGSHTHLPACRPVCMQPRMAPSGEPVTGRPAYRMQSTRAHSSIPVCPVSSHAPGTGTNARTAHNCVASVESSSREIIVVARGRRSAADRRVYLPASSRPVIDPTSAGGGTQSASMVRAPGLWECPRRADGMSSGGEKSESSCQRRSGTTARGGASEDPASRHGLVESCPTHAAATVRQQHQEHGADCHRQPWGA
eukprot:2095267-Rhodomonas_salina.2